MCGGKQVFGAHDVDSYAGEIYQLGDVHVASDGDERVGVGAGEGGVDWADLRVRQEGDHVADGHFGGGFEVFVEAHGDEVGGGFGAGPFEAVGIVVRGLVEDELEGAGELGLHGGDVDLAVALAGVAVADFEVCAFGVDGDVEGGACGEFLVVHVAGIHPGWGGVGFAGGGGDAHGAEEGVQRDVDLGGEVTDHFFAVEADDFGPGVGEVVGEEATARAKGVAGPGDVDGDLLDADFEDVAGFGVRDGDGAGEDVASGTLVGGGELVVDVADVLGDFGGWNSGGFEALSRTAGGKSLDDDGVAGVYGEGGFGGSVVVAPDDGLRGGKEGVGGLVCVLGGEGGGDCEEDCGKK